MIVTRIQVEMDFNKVIPEVGSLIMEWVETVESDYPAMEDRCAKIERAISEAIIDTLVPEDVIDKYNKKLGG